MFPALPPSRGKVTIVETFEATCAEQVHATADRWAHSVWEAYTPLRALARGWVAEALAMPSRPARG